MNIPPSIDDRSTLPNKIKDFWRPLKPRNTGTSDVSFSLKCTRCQTELRRTGAELDKLTSFICSKCGSFNPITSDQILGLRSNYIQRMLKLAAEGKITIGRPK